MTTRHEFLAQLHELLQPRGYLEIGVQYGTSLALAKCPAIGIDPAPMVQGHLADTQLFTMTSDQFFHDYDPIVDVLFPDELDLVFIDGMHLFEYALRDFENVEDYANPRTVIVFDDVLPRNQHEAARDQCPGDWTGDVWKTIRLIKNFRKDLQVHLVNTTPTGTAVVYGFSPDRLRQAIWPMIKEMGLEGWTLVPDDVINRADAVDPQWALGLIMTYMQELNDADRSHRG